jgi:AcrR family transcriptional regulator
MVLKIEDAMKRTKSKPRKPALASPMLAPSRERILNAAFSAFTEKGYARTSTLEIATRAKVSKRELYALCADKSALLRDAVTERAKRMRLALELPAAKDGLQRR